ncbi:neuropilin-1a-like [Clytia hemisphaerica]|uniref:F5/8 type C domain-containing protein n=1 Tax=Clytia hemisphaerica TaxID=252671 RepID=A0A7M5WKV2_9CNID
MKILVIIFVFQAILNLGHCTSVKLELKISHELTYTEMSVNDSLRYTIQLQHDSSSSQEANNIVLEISLPYYVTFEMVDPVSMTTVIDNELNTIQLKPSDNIQIGNTMSLSYDLMLTDADITTGRHHIVTPVKLSYNGLQNDIVVYNVPFTVAGCSGPLGMTNGSIQSYQLSSTSSYIVSEPTRARYSADGDAWCAQKEDQNQYIQIDLAYESRITALSTKGRQSKEMWVEQYQVEYSLDGDEWYMYTENGFPKMFTGNVDKSQEVKNWMSNPIRANFIRIRPVQWVGGMCLRFELFGCAIKHTRNCIDPLGMEDGRITINSLSQNFQGSNLNESRLNYEAGEFPHGWQAKETNTAEESHLEIDLGSLSQIKKIAIQGSYPTFGTTSSFYVKTFHLRFSKNGKDFSKIIDNSVSNFGEKSFIGPQDSSRAAVGALVPIQSNVKIEGRYIRIVPEEFITFKVMRVELYGCMVEDNFKYQDTPVELSRRSYLTDRVTDDVFICMYNKEKEKSSCHATNGGNGWRAIHPDVVAILSKEQNKTRVFGVNRAMQIVMSENLGVDWYNLSPSELTKQQQNGYYVNAVNIDDLLPNTFPPLDKYRWQTQQGTEWGVSGEGLFFKPTQGVDWTKSAQWKCCVV